MADERHEPFFIVGCQRSGTTLLRLVLECHARIECVDEPLSYRVAAGLVRHEARRPLLGLKIPCLTEQLRRPTWWDVNLLPEVRAAYRGQRVLFMVRDVRDTVASMCSLRVRGDRRWLDTYLAPALAAKRQRDAEFGARYEAQLEQVDRSPFPELAGAALYWRSKVDAFFDHIAAGVPVLLLRYEDLVCSSRLELMRVCGFLQMPWDEALLRHTAFAHDEGRGDERVVGGTDPHRAIDDASVGRWRGAFTDAELVELVRFAGDRQDELYGPVASDFALSR